MENYKIPKIHNEGSDITVETNHVFSFHTHTHSFFEMTLYEPFNGEITINNKAFNISTPTAILIIPSDFHKIEVKGKNTAKYIKISFNAGLLGKDFTPYDSIILKNVEDSSLLFQLFKEIQNLEEGSIYKRHLVHTAAFVLTEKGEKILPSKSTASGYQYAKRAVEIINENFSEDISLSSVAAQLSVSPQYLSCVFKNSIGLNFSKYSNDIRLHRASKLLIETEESVTRICEICGFGNLSHFLRCFKNKFGLSPSAYRKTNRT